MCFDQKSSFGFAFLGLFVAHWINTRTNNKALAGAVFFFFTMEFLQGLQYFVIAPDLNSPLCDVFINKALTLVGFLHICLQPYFTHVISSSLTRNPVKRKQWEVIKRLSLIGGFLLFSRYLISEAGYLNNMDVSQTDPKNSHSTEWLRGDKLCTFNGNFHLAWSVPMADPSYIVMGAGIHSFLMFAPFLAFYDWPSMVAQGFFLFATGPGLAAYITPNLMEQASIWCFFSIGQISIMLFAIRGALASKDWNPQATEAPAKKVK
jgi:hypothetical protein